MVLLANTIITINIRKFVDILSQQMRSDEQRVDEEKLKKKRGKITVNTSFVFDLAQQYLHFFHNFRLYHLSWS